MPRISELRGQRQETEMFKANPGHVKKEEKEPSIGKGVSPL